MELEVEGATIAYDVAGDGPPVLLVHGFTLDRTMWSQQVDTLVAARTTVVRVDLRGHGGSSPNPPNPAPFRHADDLQAVLEALTTGPAIVVGASLGAQHAVELALTRPASCAALVLCGPQLPLAGLPDLEGLRDVWRAARRDPAEARQLWLELPLFADERTRPAVAARVRTMAERFTGFDARTPMAWGIPLDPPVEERLGALAVPTLVVVGGDDVGRFRQAAELTAERVPGARLEVVEGVGHLVPMTDPNAFEAVLVPFVRRVLGPLPSA